MAKFFQLFSDLRELQFDGLRFASTVTSTDVCSTQHTSNDTYSLPSVNPFHLQKSFKSEQNHDDNRIQFPPYGNA